MGADQQPALLYAVEEMASRRAADLGQIGGSESAKFSAQKAKWQPDWPFVPFARMLIGCYNLLA